MEIRSSLTLAHSLLAVLVASALGLAPPVAAAAYRVIVEADSPRLARVEATVTPDEGWLRFNDEANQGYLHGWSTFVRELEVRDGRGHRMAAVYSAPSRWRLPDWASGPVEVSYTLHLQHDRLPLAFGDNGAAYARAGVVMWSGRALFLAGAPEQGIEVTLELPEDWNVATPWSEIGARNYSVASTTDLVNSAWIAGSLVQHTLESDRAEVRLALAGPAATGQREVLIELAEEFLAEFSATVGPAPRERLLILGADAGYWGGEVMGRSVSLSVHEQLAGTESFPLPVLNLMSHLMAHEIFHLWGTAMGPVDDEAEVADLSWFQEGFAADYGALLAELRTGRLSGDQMLGVLTEQLRLYRSASQTRVSLRRAGAQKALNSGLVYQGGALAAFILDVELRRRTAGRQSLPGLFRHLYARFASGASLTFDRLMEEVDVYAGGEVAGLLASMVGSVDPLPVEAALARVGVRVEEGEGELRLRRAEGVSAAQAELWRAIVGN